MKESEIQTKIKNKLTASGYFVVKLIQTSANGIPDLMALKDGTTLFFEVKAENGRLSDLQKYRIEQLEKNGFQAIVARSVDDVKKFCI